ncbi:hypothetical protein D2T31_20645 [Sinirhodobacter populi]|uniref:Antitoxin VbhA domain-containing protein n=1 Tax=Paenirhodobacter populi TaxID=2306993 RepID=A0A443K0B7_9RHOB|nr:antitoxin VbhA family protein [Sinirhodobacter populi]RWR26228.1 hypothetical protein D2T31_20645 [Sinirhodobacter populi]
MRIKTTQSRTDKPTRSMPPARILASAIAGQEIEGLRVDPLALAELREVAAGDLSPTELRVRLLERYRRVSATD